MSSLEVYGAVSRPPATQCNDLGFQQRFYLHLQQGGRNLSLLDGPFAFAVSGPLNVTALSRSVEELIARHDSLRMRISFADRNPRQWVVAPYYYAPELIHVRGTRDEVRQCAEALVGKERQLNGQQLFEIQILRMSEFEHVLIFAIHHLISDHVSRMRLLRELWALYGAFIVGAASPFAGRPTQFLKYLEWQRETHLSWLQECCAHWVKHLEGAIGIRWQDASDRNQGHRDAVATTSVSFSSCLTEDLRILAKQAKTSLSIEILAIYVAMLRRLCGEKDFIVGVSTTGRDRMEFYDTLGLLSHALYLRIRLSGKESFIDLLNLVNQEYFRALFCKDFGGIVLDSPALLSGTLFQWFPSLDGFQDGLPIEAEKKQSQLDVEWLSLEPPCFADAALTKYLDLMLIFGEKNGSIFGLAFYRPGVFSSEMIQRFLLGLKRLAEQCIARPTHCLAESLS
jgi:hypothetical protein